MRGKVVDLAGFADSKRDHPRLCGEKSMSKHRKRQSTGSPPPMRGKAKTTDESFQEDGITPAYAGKSFMHIRENGMV